MTARLASKPDVLGEAAPGSSVAARAAQPRPFPTRAQEEWRYADLDALKPVWESLAEPERIEIPDRGSLELVWLPGTQAVQVRRVHIVLGKGAKARIFALSIAEEYGRVELEVELAQGADFELHAANIGTGLSTNEVVSNVRHLEPDGRSRQVIRSVLGGKAVGSYLGRVAVARDAQQTDGEQSVKAVLLDRGATANARPELEIYADDVKCAHGASVGELDPAQMFYATSRGLPPAQARALLLEGFVMGLWDSIEDEKKREAIAEAARAALREVSQ